jgi:hypothetical protein
MIGSFGIGQLGSTQMSRLSKLQADNANLAFKNRTLSATVAKQNAALQAQAQARQAQQ